jgi:hypothetical protein
VDIVAEGVVIGGRYRLGPLLGRGGMADVYDAYDERLARRVAVKLLRQDLGANPGVRGRFEAEAKAAARLSHPNVVAVHDTGDEHGRVYIVMERLPGETLADRFATGPVEQEWLRQVAFDVLAALGAAHAAGIIHRDVKPGNILLTHDGRAKVADFGIAKTVEGLAGRGPEDDPTGVGMVIGTPAYLAPERIDGRAATPQSDLYAVGIVLYEGLTGRQPFAGTTLLTMAYLIRHEPPPDPRQFRPDAQPSLVAAIARAIAYDAEARFGSAGEMAAALGAGVAVSGADRQATTAVGPSVPMALAQPVGPPTAVLPRVPRRPPRRPARALRGRWLPIVAGAAALGLGILALTLAGSRHGQSPVTSIPGPTGGPNATAPATTVPRTTATPPPPAADPVGTQLVALANQLSPNDGAQAGQLQAGLRHVAALPAGSQARSDAATRLLAQASGWYQRGQLSFTAFEQALSVLPPAGAALPAPSTTVKRKHKGGGGNG